MKIAFWNNNPSLDYTADTPFEAPLGGTESAAVYLAVELAARGHAVTFINFTSTPGRYRNVDFPGAAAVSRDMLNSFDAVVVVSRAIGKRIRETGVTVPLVLWQHGSPPNNLAQDLANPAEREAWTAVAYVSDHQRKGFVDRFGLDGVVLRNAASPGAMAAPLRPSFVERGEDPVLIYASAPGRGLDFALVAFATIREQFPGARFRVLSDQGIYQQGGDKDECGVFYALARSLPGVEFIGSVSQPALGLEFSRADILAYPTSFVETSCIVAMEAAVTGCLVHTTALGALPETMNGFGFLMEDTPSRLIRVRNLAERVTKTVIDARAEPNAFHDRRERQIAWFRATHTWEHRAAEWEAFLQKSGIKGA